MATVNISQMRNHSQVYKSQNLRYANSDGATRSRSGPPSTAPRGAPQFGFAGGPKSMSRLQASQFETRNPKLETRNPKFENRI